MIRKRERLLDGKVFAVDKVMLSGGTERYVVEHGGGVVVLPILDDGRIVLIRNERFAIGETLWELCAGTLEKGEDPVKAASRELAEETGYEAGNIEPLCGFYTCPGFCTEFLHCYLATGLRHVGQSLEEGEEISVEVLEPARVIEMIRSGEIHDGKTVSAVLHWWALRGGDDRRGVNG